MVWSLKNMKCVVRKDWVGEISSNKERKTRKEKDILPEIYAVTRFRTAYSTMASTNVVIGSGTDERAAILI